LYLENSFSLTKNKKLMSITGKSGIWHQ